MNAFKTSEGKQAVIEYYNTLLSRMNIPHEEFSVATRYGDTFLLAAGGKEKEPVILLHGSSMNSAMWIRDIEEMSEYFRVYAPDLPGEPGRSNDKQLPFDNMDYAFWLSDVLEALHISTVNLVGLSLGAWLAAKFASNYADKVRRLVLLCPAGIGGQNHAFKDIAMALLPKGESGIDELLQMINRSNPIPEILLNYQKLILGVFNSRMEAIPLFTDEDLRRLTMPSLLIVGEKDIMLNSLETAERYKRLVPNASIMVLPDAGHALTGKTGEIISFLAK
ncbi:MAG: alpha/beta hydrolase [Syntrophomonadaceae bacterium]|jgi:pimeloyl-ACP methyl ester carboxylesterase|nr:alpha/beta hydrolase [Syntrophomonadaceae bacterium]